MDERTPAVAVGLARLRKHYHGIVRSMVRYQIRDGFIERDQASPSRYRQCEQVCVRGLIVPSDWTNFTKRVMYPQPVRPELVCRVFEVRP